MINHRLEEWATKFRASKLYLRALSRKKQEKTPHYTTHQHAHTINKKVLEASRFTQYTSF